MTSTKLFILLSRLLIVSNLITTQPAPPAMLLIKVGGFARHSRVLACLCLLSIRLVHSGRSIRDSQTDTLCDPPPPPPPGPLPPPPPPGRAPGPPPPPSPGGPPTLRFGSPGAGSQLHGP